MALSSNSILEASDRSDGQIILRIVSYGHCSGPRQDQTEESLRCVTMCDRKAFREIIVSRCTTISERHIIDNIIIDCCTAQKHQQHPKTINNSVISITVGLNAPYSFDHLFSLFFSLSAQFDKKKKNRKNILQKDACRTYEIE